MGAAPGHHCRDPVRAGRVGAKLRYARSALGPCHNGRARAWAVTNGRPRFGGTAGHEPFGSSSWDNADERFRLWSRRSAAESSPRCPTTLRRVREQLEDPSPDPLKLL
jgi:hypothetical protein